ncbi:MAG: TetR/AcrR family transcriptional regulator [Pseudomonadales bacterium]|jgi:AcrR family transcriptional regulator
MADDADQPSLRDRKKREARQRILNATDRLIRSRGYEQTKMRDIAKAADLSYQTLYNYFPTKGQILRTLLTEQVEGLARRFQEVLTAYDGGLLTILERLNAISFEAVDGPERELWRIATVEMFQQEDARRTYRLIDEMAHEALEHLLETARDRGELSASVDLPRLAAILFDLADYGLLKFILDPQQTVAAALDELSAEIRIVVAPYLTRWET